MYVNSGEGCGRASKCARTARFTESANIVSGAQVPSSPRPSPWLRTKSLAKVSNPRWKAFQSSRKELVTNAAVA
jgi:hypothetical protein